MRKNKKKFRFLRNPPRKYRNFGIKNTNRNQDRSKKKGYELFDPNQDENRPGHDPSRVSDEGENKNGSRERERGMV